MNAYDYTNQTWVDGIEGARVRLAQIEKQIEIVNSERGADYMKSVLHYDGSKSTCLVKLNHAKAECEDEIAKARTTHAPGKWYVHKSSTGNLNVREVNPRDRDTAGLICTVHGFEAKHPHDDEQANAHANLIASAPQLKRQIDNQAETIKTMTSALEKIQGVLSLRLHHAFTKAEIESTARQALDFARSALAGKGGVS